MAHAHHGPTEELTPPGGKHPRGPRDVWQTIGGLDLAQRAVGFIGDRITQFEHSITAAVVGGPEADIRRCWYLALSMAFGKYRQGPRGVFKSVSIQGTWDVTGKVAQVELTYTLSKWENITRELGDWVVRNPVASLVIGTSLIALGAATAFIPGLGAAAVAGGAAFVGGAMIGGGLAGRALVPAAGADPTATPYGFLHRGPEQLTVGGDWPDELKLGDGPKTPDTLPSWVAQALCAKAGLGFAKRVRVSVLGYSRGRDIFREYPHLGGTAFDGYPMGVVFGFNPFQGTWVAGFGDPFVSPDPRGMVTLPDNRRVILTAERSDPRVQPPAPVLDGVSRSDLLALVAQSLQSPCYLPESPACEGNNAAHGGVFLGRPGDNLSPTGLARAMNAAGRDLAYAAPAPRAVPGPVVAKDAPNLSR